MFENMGGRWDEEMGGGEGRHEKMVVAGGRDPETGEDAGSKRVLMRLSGARGGGVEDTCFPCRGSTEFCGWQASKNRVSGLLEPAIFVRCEPASCFRASRLSSVRGPVSRGHGSRVLATGVSLLTSRVSGSWWGGWRGGVDTAGSISAVEALARSATGALSPHAPGASSG